MAAHVDAARLVLIWRIVQGGHRLVRRVVHRVLKIAIAVVLPIVCNELRWYAVRGSDDDAIRHFHILFTILEDI